MGLSEQAPDRVVPDLFSLVSLATASGGRSTLAEVPERWEFSDSSSKARAEVATRSKKSEGRVSRSRTQIKTVDTVVGEAVISTAKGGLPRYDATTIDSGRRRLTDGTGATGEREKCDGQSGQ